MLWKKPWRLAEGWLITGGLMAVGLLLQLSAGPMQWSLLAWPLNGLALALLLVVIALMAVLGRRSYACHFMSTYAAAVPALAAAATLTVVMGLIAQRKEGSWLTNMLAFWPFVLVYTQMVVVVGLALVRRLCHLRRSIADLSFVLNHLGLFVALTAATLGSADMQRLQMWTTNNAPMANMLAGADIFTQYQRFAVDEQGNNVELPLAVELSRFIAETYDDGSPRRYASEVVIYSKASMHRYAATVDVNHPVSIDGWKIYQKDYRLTQLGDACQVSILELVCDPWLPWVYGGIGLMLAGALTLLLTGSGQRKTRNTESHELE